MRKLSPILALLMIAVALLACGCHNDDAWSKEYINKQLSNSPDNKIVEVWAPSHSFGSTRGPCSTDEEAESVLQQFRSLTFHHAGRTNDQTIEKMLTGDFGQTTTEQNKPPLPYCVVGGHSYKYVVALHYENNSWGVFMVDYDGTVYYANDLDLEMMQTDANAVNSKDFIVRM